MVSIERGSGSERWIIPSGIETEEALAELVSVRAAKPGVQPANDPAGGIRQIDEYLQEIHKIGSDSRFVGEWNQRAKSGKR